MRVIGFKDIENLNISPADCYHWVSEMILRKQDALLPPKTHMNIPNNVFCNVMPCVVPNDAGVKMGG